MSFAFTLTIETDNAAFDEIDNGEAFEVARILRDLAERIEAGDLWDTEIGNLRDLNGNKVGGWRFDRR
jgi:hypothetical protein